MKSRSPLILALIVLVVIFAVFFTVLNIFLMKNSFLDKDANKQSEKSSAEEVYNPQINPSDFTAKINNKYLTFTPGTTYIYEGNTEEGRERTEVYATGNIKKIMGVEVVEVRDRVWLNDELIEDTKDWYAQDKLGNVWYFGEDSKEFVNGKVVSTGGSWVAGYYGAKPGIVMKANPQVGDVYRQEYYPGEAEDMEEIIALSVKIKVKYGSFFNCLQIKDINPLEPGDEEYKYYCPEAGNVVYEVGIEDGEAAQLVDIEKGSKPSAAKEEPLQELKTEITEQEAIAIAKREVNGDVTDVGIEKKFGKAAYVVEINADGEEIDVIIDIQTGQVLGTED